MFSKLFKILLFLIMSDRRKEQIILKTKRKTCASKANKFDKVYRYIGGGRDRSR